MKDAFLKYSEIIEEELHAYEDLSELYKTKEEVLVQGKSDELWDIDSKVVEQAKVIKQIEENRQKMAELLGNQNIKLEEIIQKTSQFDKELSEKFEELQKKLKELSRTISLQQKKHMSLIEHGLKMVDKTMDIIYNVAAPQNQQYDKYGHNIKTNTDTVLSSIIEEA